MIKKFPNKKIVALLIGGVMLAELATLLVVVPITLKAIANIHLKQVTMNELLPLVPAVSDLRDADPESQRQCSERSASQHSYTTRKLWCQEMFVYRYDGQPLPESMRAVTVQKAGILDELLKQKGWTPTRPDKAQTIVDAIPSAPLAAFHSSHVTFRKEVDGVRCRFSISFGGPTDGSSPGIVGVTDLSCMHEVSFFSLHIPRFTKQGFTPI